jgi:hypothetical protein
VAIIANAKVTVTNTSTNLDLLGQGGNAQIDNAVSSATAGQITGTASSARIIQRSGKLTF